MPMENVSDKALTCKTVDTNPKTVTKDVSQIEIFSSKEKIASRASVKEGIIPPNRVDDDSLHPIVAKVKAKEQKQQEEWQTVTTRSSRRLQRKMDEFNQDQGVGDASASTSGNG
ncbi:hypothetical protein RIF29_19517 [Crotalaria pallida]|uniref:Uncharacterized protein n=1 Tax=Crotalaria pallida TaxID=3830 RepID=A0AAN9I6K7_CROPI